METRPIDTRYDIAGTVWRCETRVELIEIDVDVEKNGRNRDRRFDRGEQT